MEYTIYTRLDYSMKEIHVPEKVIFLFNLKPCSMQEAELLSTS